MYNRIALSKRSWYIGGKKVVGTWVWLDGDLPPYAFTFTNWTPKNPNNSGECMETYTYPAYYKSQKGGTWNGVDCTSLRAYICESSVQAAADSVIV